MVFEELRRMVVEIDIPELKRYHKLRNKIIEIMYQLLQKTLLPTNQMVKNLIRIEDAYINTSHPDFMGGAAAMVNVFDPANYSEKKKKPQIQHDAFNFESIRDQVKKEGQGIKASISAGVL
jgi:dynamin 1-like protein